MGANVLVLGDAWHKPGSLDARDAAELKVAVAKARNVGMRVILSVPLVRPGEAKGLFDGLLSPNRDGLMVYGLGPATMKPDADPDAPACDLADRVEVLAGLRRLVGDDGILLGRSDAGLPPQIEMAFLDAVTPGEDVAEKLLRSAEGMLRSDAACGCALSPLIVGGDVRTQANLAAVPASPQLVLGANVSKRHALAPLWKLLSRLDGPVIHALSPRLENNLGLRVEPKKVPVLAYLTRTKMLLVVANPGGKSRCRITIGGKLGIKADAAGVLITVVDGELKETPFRLADGVIDIPELAAGEVRAYEFGRE